MSIGQRLIPQVIDDLAGSYPDDVWAAYPSSMEALAQGDLTHITWKTLSNSINRLEWWLTDRLGEGGKLDTLCYVGPSDIRYFMFATAACKAGYKVVLTSRMAKMLANKRPRPFFRHHATKLPRTCRS